MQKQNDHSYRFDYGVPLLVSILVGVLFFGAYLAVGWLYPEPPRGIIWIFVAAYLVFSAVIYGVYLFRQYKKRTEQVMHLTLNDKMHNLFKYTVALPYAIVDDQGRVRVVNDAMQHLIGAEDPFYRGNISDLCGGVTLADMIEAERYRPPDHLSTEALKEGKEPMTPPPEDAFRVTRGGKVVQLMDNGRYTARVYEVELNHRTNYMITFADTAELLDLKEKTEREMPAVAYIDIDNLEELTQYTRTSYRDVSRRVDDILIHFAASVNGFLREYERDRYVLLFSQEKLRECEADKFSNLLDKVRDIRLGEYSIPVTLSVGVSLSDATMAVRASEAENALDMALQRGGDQVAVRRADGIRYYGGQTRPFRRRTKVQSRVVANFLLSKISGADNLLIMGHRNPDYDCIGAAVGIAQFGLFAGVPTKIISNLSDLNFRIATKRLAASPMYADLFVSAHKGLDLVRPGTLLVIVDVNNLSVIESPEIADNVREVSGKIAIIDHHLQTGEYNFDPVMNYIDTSASSACELVSEMLEQSETGSDHDINQLVNDEVASVMLSGIMLDTGRFARNTGTRTLDAARYLYGKGANAERVNTFFNQSYEDYVCERSFSGCMLLHGNTVGVTWSAGTGRGADDRIAAAKEADRLLAVRGVGASFALVMIDGDVHISGRSDGSINVQLICERMGGGGRFDSAGASLSGTTIEKALEQLQNAVAEHFADLEASHRND
jgi:c-di-AMP phosphodiesterase-like protein